MESHPSAPELHFGPDWAREGLGLWLSRSGSRPPNPTSLRSGCPWSTEKVVWAGFAHLAGQAEPHREKRSKLFENVRGLLSL